MPDEEITKKLSQTTKANIKLESKLKAEVKGKIKRPLAPVAPSTRPKPSGDVSQVFEQKPVDLSSFQPTAEQAEPESEPGKPAAGILSDGKKTSRPSRGKPPAEQAKEKLAEPEEKPAKKDFGGGGPYDEEEAQEEREAEEQGEEPEDRDKGKKKKEEEGEEEKPTEEEGAEEGAGAEQAEAEGEEAAAEEGAAAERAGAEGAGAEAETGAAAGAEGAEAGALAGEEGAAAAGAGAEAAGAAGAEAAAGAAAGAAEGAEVAAAAATSEIWGPACIVIIIVIALLLVLLLGTAAYGLGGRFGKTANQATGKNSPEVQKLVDSSNAASPVNGYTQIQIDPKDVQYLNDGNIDRRLVGSLNYLVGAHKHLIVSHIETGYEDMKVNPESNSQLVANISAHHDGLAADITEIDFVYKVLDPKTQTVVFYNDLVQELLRLSCQDPANAIACAVNVNTTFKDPTGIEQPAEGLPVKIIYQDTKPDNPHAGNTADPGLSLSPTDQQIYDKVYQPEARRKVHQVIAELLAYPGTTDTPTNYRVTQLITYSQERDVQPFIDDGTLDKVYGTNRPNNYGLFAMEEAWQNIHIGY